MTINEMLVRVDATTKGLERGMDRAEKSMDDFADKTARASISAEQSVKRIEAAIKEAEEETEDLDRALEKVDGKEVDIEVKTGRESDRLLSALSEASSRISGFSRAMGVLRTRIPKVAAGIGALSAALAVTAGGMIAATTATVGLTAALGGVVGGFGAAGVAAAAMSEEVQDAFSRLKSAVQAGALILTRPIQAALADMASQLGGVFGQIAPELESIFADIAGYIRAFSEALLPVVDSLMPSLIRVVGAARPVVDSFTQGLVSLGPTLNKSLGNIEGAVPAIQAMVDRLFQSLNELIPFLTKLFASLAKVGEPLVDSFFDTFETIIKGFGQFLKTITALGNALTRDVELSFDYVKGVGSDLATAFRGVIPGGGTQPSYFDQNPDKVQKMLRSMLGIKEEATGASPALQKFLDKLKNLGIQGFRTGEELSVVEKAMQSLSETIQGVELGGKLAKARGEFDRLTQQEAKLEAVGSAWQDVAMETGENSAEAQKLWSRYQAILDKIREIKKARATGRVEGLGPVDAGSGGGPSLDALGYSVSNRQIADQMSRIVAGWKKASNAIGRVTKDALGRAISSASQQFGQEFSGAIMSLFRGPDEHRVASLEERNLSLKDRLTQLRESLRQGELSHEMYSAKVRAIHTELAETNKQLARETAGVFERVFRGIGNLVQNVIQQVIASISAAIAKAAVLAGISALTGGGGSFLDFLSGKAGVGDALSGVFSAPGAVSPRPAMAMQSGGITVHVTGQLEGRGQDLLGTINTTQQANTRRGRG